jgi:DNA-binding HxlR family transcriptional regulator
MCGVTLEEEVKPIDLVLQRGVYEILKILAEKEVVRSRQLTKLVKSVSMSTLYKRLRELEALGLIQSEEKEEEGSGMIPIAKYYKITPLGKKILEMLDRCANILDSEIESRNLKILNKTT